MQLNTAGNKTQQLRENANITPEALAQYLGVTTKDMLAYESDEKQLDISQLEKVAKLFDQSIRDLTNGTIKLDIKQVSQYLNQYADDWDGIAAINQIAQNIREMSEISKTQFGFAVKELTTQHFIVTAETENQGLEILTQFIQKNGVDAETPENIIRLGEPDCVLGFDPVRKS